ncbi:MAG: DEAD/DEAH box helicase [Oscillospiraceae bacterium]|jgi:ATP-dependent helicase YprA (DUF1998 family)|nr:DEAD/DEAH box helicase [Oscillospiraceae bacterium]
MFNPAKASENIKKAYVDYIATSYHFRNPVLRDNFVKQLNATVSNGTFVEIKDIFKTGKSISELIDEGVLSRLFKDVEKQKNEKTKILPLARPLYKHQEKAIRLISSKHNVVVSTGTGSGKTNCFLIPILNELLREQEAGSLTSGVRAIFISPMNALANDQIGNLRELLMYYPDITFGVYNGGTEQEEKAAENVYRAMFEKAKYPKLRSPLPNEKISRASMREAPPNIVFTNYAMLEHMLLRPDDDKIFSNSELKFVVLDEAHVYNGAKGIETSFLMSRLSGRIKSNPQFILTSATLGGGYGNEEETNADIVKFATALSGKAFNTTDIVKGERETYHRPSELIDYPVELFVQLAATENEQDLFVDDIIAEYNLSNSSEDINEFYYNTIIGSSLYWRLRRYSDRIRSIHELAKAIELTDDAVISFIALCTKARKNGKALLDARYHYFVRTLDGAYLRAEDYNSLSLERKTFGDGKAYFEIAVCNDCGKLAYCGIVRDNKLQQARHEDPKVEFFQAIIEGDIELSDDDKIEAAETIRSNPFVLCKNCGAIVPKDEDHNKWCLCGNTEPLVLYSASKVSSASKGKCLNCNGTLRRFYLGYDAATSVLATALYEELPYQTYEDAIDTMPQKNIFMASTVKQKKIKQEGRQFIVFSDSRQGAAKFACHLGDIYKEFLRRRSIWKIVDEKKQHYPNGIPLLDFVGILENNFSTKQVFREDNSPNGKPSALEARRNAWVAILNELYNYKRANSLFSLGKITFQYLGITDELVEGVANNYKKTPNDVRNFLSYLVFEIVKTAAIFTGDENDLKDSDREYIYYAPTQKYVTKEFDTIKQYFIPRARQKKDGTVSYSSQRFANTKKFFNISDNDAIELLRDFWDYLISPNNPYQFINLQGDGKKYLIPAKGFNILIEGNEGAKWWQCNKCGDIEQFNIEGKCLNRKCDGHLHPFDASIYRSEHYYAKLYDVKRLAPLFIKEHTAQLAKKDALDYQQMFIRKEINALSCSTTFEMGVDVGGLETVFLRNMPPLPSNYAQRVGRAGRSRDAAAFALTFARLSSHDMTFFNEPKLMISGKIMPPIFKLENRKILLRHIYAVAFAMYFQLNPEQYNHNVASKFINQKGYKDFERWLNAHPTNLSDMLKRSFPQEGHNLVGIHSFDWLDDFIGDNGAFTKRIQIFENDVVYLKKQIEKAHKEHDVNHEAFLVRQKKRYENNELIDFLVRGGILPKYGFPIDSVELTKNIADPKSSDLNLTRDLAVAIADYAPSSEVVANGRMFTSRYIKKPLISGRTKDWDISYISECPDCKAINYSRLPVDSEGQKCVSCECTLYRRDFSKSIEPRAGFLAEKTDKDVPMSKQQDRHYRTEAFFVGDPDSIKLDEFEVDLGNASARLTSTTNDSLVVKSKSDFYVCHDCGYTIADDEHDKTNKYNYVKGVPSIKLKSEKDKHEKSFSTQKCSCEELHKYTIHHEFKTDLTRISFDTDTSDYQTLLSAMYAILNAMSRILNIERRDIAACLTWDEKDGDRAHDIIIYDSVPGGAGHSRRLVTPDAEILKVIIRDAIANLSSHDCSPSCYSCLRSYDNQTFHEKLNREAALDFLRSIASP